ncbi:MAG TPA: TIGR03435 family protein [Vicinamibacterales bacterium]|nr:TIGR03435 family protein [Vicinamibacterales bacterium]
MRASTPLALIVLTCTLSAQALSFDVTSVKPNTSGEQGGSSRAQPGRYVGTNVTLRRVIGLAYLPVQEFVGGPGWINTERFDIEGKSDKTPNQSQMLEMLRTLLADRFKLVVHREMREMPVYALTLARSDGRPGSQLHPSEPCGTSAFAKASAGQGRRCGGFSIGAGTLSGKGVTMAQLAAELPSATEGRQVVDRTDLGGMFDVSLTWAADAIGTNPSPADAPSIFAAIQEQLGLKLEPTKAPIEVIVIDSAERPQAD